MVVAPDHVLTLLEPAWAAREKAYAPYSKFGVGSAWLTGSGEIFARCNVENVFFGLTICAERAAAVAAIQRGQRKFTAMALAADSKMPVAPCGACRQFLAEIRSLLQFWRWPGRETKMCGRFYNYRLLAKACWDVGAKFK